MIKSQFYSGQVVSSYRILEKLGGVGTAGMPRQIGFLRSISQEGKSENSRVFTGDCDGGLDGLEPPTSPLSGAFMVPYVYYYFAIGLKLMQLDRSILSHLVC